MAPVLLRRRQSRNRHRTVERVQKRRRRRTPGRASSARERSRTVAGTASTMGAAPERSPELTREAVTPRARRLAYGHRIRTQRRRRARRRGQCPGPRKSPNGLRSTAASRKRAPTLPTFVAATSAAATKGWGGVSDEHAAVAAFGPLRSTEPACTRRDSGTRRIRSSSVAPSRVSPCRSQSGSGAVGRWRARACAGVCVSGPARQAGAGRDSGGGAGGRRLPRPASAAFGHVRDLERPAPRSDRHCH